MLRTKHHIERWVHTPYEGYSRRCDARHTWREEIFEMCVFFCTRVIRSLYVYGEGVSIVCLRLYMYASEGFPLWQNMRLSRDTPRGEGWRAANEHFKIVFGYLCHLLQRTHLSYPFMCVRCILLYIITTLDAFKNFF